MDLNLHEEVTKKEREGYLHALLSVMSADSLLGKEEIIKMYELFALFGVEFAERRQIIERLVVDPVAFQTEELSAAILANKFLKISLAKDLSLMQEKSVGNAGLKAAKALIAKINLTSGQANVIKKFVCIENQILAALGAGEEWRADEDSWKELVSHATAVGVPLAALNVAGVTGFSAAGITSGLAALGSISGLVVLGFNPMTAGIGALILGGVAVKKIADYVVSEDDSIQSSQFEELKKARLISKEAISSDQLILCRARKRELLLPARKQRRNALRASMNEALIDLS